MADGAFETGISDAADMYLRGTACMRVKDFLKNAAGRNGNMYYDIRKRASPVSIRSIRY